MYACAEFSGGRRKRSVAVQVIRQEELVWRDIWPETGAWGARGSMGGRGEGGLERGFGLSKGQPLGSWSSWLGGTDACGACVRWASWAGRVCWQDPPCGVQSGFLHEMSFLPVASLMTGFSEIALWSCPPPVSSPLLCFLCFKAVLTIWNYLPL